MPERRFFCCLRGAHKEKLLACLIPSDATDIGRPRAQHHQTVLARLPHKEAVLGIVLAVHHHREPGATLGPRVVSHVAQGGALPGRQVTQNEVGSHRTTGRRSGSRGWLCAAGKGPPSGALLIARRRCGRCCGSGRGALKLVGKPAAPLGREAEAAYLLNGLGLARGEIQDPQCGGKRGLLLLAGLLALRKRWGDGEDHEAAIGGELCAPPPRHGVLCRATRAPHKEGTIAFGWGNGIDHPLPITSELWELDALPELVVVVLEGFLGRNRRLGHPKGRPAVDTCRKPFLGLRATEESDTQHEREVVRKTIHGGIMTLQCALRQYLSTLGEGTLSALEGVGGALSGSLRREA